MAPGVEVRKRASDLAHLHRTVRLAAGGILLLYQYHRRAGYKVDLNRQTEHASVGIGDGGRVAPGKHRRRLEPA